MNDPKILTELVPVKNRDIFGDILLVQIVGVDGSKILMPDGSFAAGESRKLMVAGIGDGERVKKFNVGDVIDPLHYDQRQKMRTYDGVDYAVIGYDFVLSRVKAPAP